MRPPYNLDVLTQAALLAVLRHKPVLDEQAARLRADRGPLAAALAALPGTRVSLPRVISSWPAFPARWMATPCISP